MKTGTTGMGRTSPRWTRREFLESLSAAAVIGRPRAETLAVEHRARAMAAGEVVLITVQAPSALAATSVDGVLGAQVVAFTRHSDGHSWLGLVGLDLEAPVAPLVLHVHARLSDGAVLSARVDLAVQPKSFRTRRLDVAPRFVTPPKSVQARIEREQQVMRDVLGESAPTALWQGPWLRPVPGISLSSFGVRSVFNGQARAPHTGTDFRAPMGTPLRAPAAGVVVLAEEHYFPGNQIVLDHGLGTFSLFAHLSAFAVEKGDRVRRGSVLGATGATGRVTGPHLHWAARVGGARVDAEALLEVTVGLEPTDV